MPPARFPRHHRKIIPEFSNEINNMEIGSIQFHEEFKQIRVLLLVKLYSYSIV